MTIKQKVLNALAIGPFTTGEIATATGLTTNQVGSCLRRMRGKLVVKDGPYWELCEPPTKKPWERTDELQAMLAKIPPERRAMSQVRRVLEADSDLAPKSTPRTTWFRKNPDGSVVRI